MLNLSSIRGKFALLVSLLSVIAVTSLQAQRLPKTVIPSHYQLALDPDIAAQKFSGEETITVQIQQETNEITLNSLGLDISLAELTAGGATLPAQVTYDQPSEMVKLSFAKPVPAGAA